MSRQWEVYNSSNLIRNQINTIAKGGFYASGSLSNQIRLNVKGNITYYNLFSGPQMAMVIFRYIELSQKKYGQIQYVIGA